ncbi:NAD(P)-binding protein [Lepidopterella palustris CBS 459.81]|uniref:NAD(P)-binding protein n=1 Tax=Lepidopterella palustris CBS 459.81 TaxID=1314670 RepID=A0A8E2DWX0_9PEZI|nr:NAD(P)-binding protein [Lepidopterella palustris CBS 459.81]
MATRSGPNAPGVAFITGGARGLGNAVAVSFAKEGARGVVIVDIQNDAALNEGKTAVEAYGTKCLAIRADVTNEGEVETAIEQAVKEFGRIDYAANFAGVPGPGIKITDLELNDYLKTMTVNSTGVFLCTKHQLKQMIKQEASPGVEEGRIPQRGSIVNCASVNSLQSLRGTVGYTASKHAVHGITKTAALEARQYNIRVNAVSPGFLLTPMVAEKMIHKQSGEKNEVWKTFEGRQGRAATVDEVGDVVVLLSLPRMSLVNGQNLFIDGGFTINEANF